MQWYARDLSVRLLNYYLGRKCPYIRGPAFNPHFRMYICERCLYRSCRSILSCSPCSPFNILHDSSPHALSPRSYTASACLASCEGRSDNSPISPRVQYQVWVRLALTSAGKRCSLEFVDQEHELGSRLCLYKSYKTGNLWLPIGFMITEFRSDLGNSTTQDDPSHQRRY